MFAIVDRPEEGPRLQLEYNPNYFRSTTIQRYLESFIALLESAVQEPVDPVGGDGPVRTIFFLPGCLITRDELHREKRTDLTGEAI